MSVDTKPKIGFTYRRVADGMIFCAYDVTKSGSQARDYFGGWHNLADCELLYRGDNRNETLQGR